MYYINNKKVGQVEYIKYLEDVILIMDDNLYDAQQLGLHYSDSNIDEAVNIVKENRKRKKKIEKQPPPEPEFPKNDMFTEGVRNPEKV